MFENKKVSIEMTVEQWRILMRMAGAGERVTAREYLTYYEEALNRYVSEGNTSMVEETKKDIAEEQEKIETLREFEKKVIDVLIDAGLA